MPKRSPMVRQRVGRARARARRAPFAWLTALAIAVLLLLIALGWLLSTWQASAVLMMLPAFVPLGIVLATVWWLDRWEPEPRMLMVLALIYGAGAAILGTLISGNYLLGIAGKYLPSQNDVDAFSVLFQGPVTEEVIKAAGLVLIFLIARNEFDGPLDGLIYAALIGAGFAFTENVVYFANSVADPQNFIATLVVRCFLSPFAHVLFTGVVGMALGWGARRSHDRLRLILSFTGGLLGAIALHAFWNGGSQFILPLVGIDPSNPIGWIAWYLLMQMPLFGLAVWIILRLHDHDIAVMRSRLDEYRRAGWFTTAEVRMISDWTERRDALRWSHQQGPSVEREMRGFVRDATRLAYAREHAAFDKTDPDRRKKERALLAATRGHRAALAAARRTATASSQAGVVASGA